MFNQSKIIKMKNSKNSLQQLRGFTVKYLPETNTRGSRVKITDTRFNKSVTFPFSFEDISTLDLAVRYLKNLGFEPLNYIHFSNPEHWLITANNWGENIIFLS